MDFFRAASDQYEDMDILVIGAGPAPDNAPGHEREFRMFSSVRNDIQRLYERCAEAEFRKSTWTGSKPSGYLNVRQCLINHEELAPVTPQSSQQLERTVYQPTVYNSVQAVRHNLRNFIEHQLGPNLMIYFSGHGTYDDHEHGAAQGESLTIPVRVVSHYMHHQHTELEHYTASDLTADINLAMRRRTGNNYEACDAKVFVVIDACHAGGLVNMWSLDRSTRLKDFIVLFAGAETNLVAHHQTGGLFTKTFFDHLRKGVKLSDLAQQVLEALYEPSQRAPCVRYSHPSLCDKHFLKA